MMLVDLARNDLARVCEPGTVRPSRLLEVERYSHVMHLVSDVQGRLRDTEDAFSLLRDTFPAGTVSGAPKVRAMQIISELEPHRRGIYAGAVGYIGFGGAMDTCIALRTIVIRDGVVRLQAGGGVVADSVPESEHDGVHQQDGRPAARGRPGRDGGVRTMTARVLLIDNYDSFTYNLAHGMAEQGAHVDVFRHDELTADEAVAHAADAPRHLPRPRPAVGDRHLGRPDRAAARAACRSSASAWATSCWPRCTAAPSRTRSGSCTASPGWCRSWPTTRCSRAWASEFEAGRYHSLAAIEPLPADFLLTARAADGEVMAMRHRTAPTHGVQFHPESILTPLGPRLLRNFLELTA